MSADAFSLDHRIASKSDGFGLVFPSFLRQKISFHKNTHQAHCSLELHCALAQAREERSRVGGVIHGSFFAGSEKE